MGAPTGTVTFLFTDVEGSTRLWQQDEAAMRTAVARHDELIRAAVAARGGHVFATGGDGFAVAFARAGDAIAAAVDAQAALTAEPWPATAPVRVRMGVHTGDAEERGGDYFGTEVNRAARLMAVANAGQVVCSPVTAGLVREVELVDLGEHRLRDLSAAQRVFQVGTARFPPLRSVDAFPGNLPLQLSSFIGREGELARVDKALHDARLVTLTGVGGVGKTRLALQVAALVLPRFPDGAWLVELAAVRDPAGVLDAVAAVFDVTARGGKTLGNSLVDFLRAKRLLLVLDNAEHLLEAVASLVGLVERSCAGVAVLVTSREGLAVEGERVLPVPSLASPSPEAGVEATSASDAVRLFVERAEAADPDFVLSEANAAAVAEVCRRLDGVPLAIELAAARVNAMTPAELVKGLDRRFATLAGGRRGAVQRHQTLRAAIDWSYELLTDSERRVLTRLSVFAGGCTRDAAEQVCGAPPVPAGEMFEALSGLVAKSLVVAVREGTETRYRLLETIREYGEEHLAELEETDALRSAHAEYFCEWAGRLRDQLIGPEQVVAARRLAADYDNLLTATQYAIDTGDCDLALRMVAAQPPGGLQVGYRFALPVQAVLTLPGARDHPRYALALMSSAALASFHGELERSEALAAEAFAALPGMDDDWRVEAGLMECRAGVAGARGSFAESAQLLATGAEIARTGGAGAVGLTSIMLSSAAMAQTMGGNPEAGVRFATEAVLLARESGAPTFIAASLTALAGTLAAADPPRARAALDESLQLQQRFVLDSGTLALEGTLIAARVADWPLVLRVGRDALDHMRWTGDRSFLSGLLNILARALVPSDPESAAVLQGAARRFVPAATGASPEHALGPDLTAAHRDAPHPGSFFMDVRREATALLRDAIGDERVRALRVDGETMRDDDVVRFVIEVIERNLESRPRE